MSAFTLDKVERTLGYKDAPTRYLSTGEADSSIAHLSKSASRAGVVRSYYYEASTGEHGQFTRRAAVHVASADTLEECSSIHKKLWNLGDAPFLIVVLPNQVRVYSSYSFSSRDDQVGLLVSEGVDTVSSALADFAAEEIDSGRVWAKYVPKLDPKARVDQRLLRSLEDLAKRLKESYHLPLPQAQSLIGKFIYIRYLVDRNIIDPGWLESQGIDLADVLYDFASLRGLRSLDRALEQRFGGSIFPVELEGDSAPSDAAVAFIASVFRGDDPQTGQKALDFRVYDFEYIPVETLSSIYEQFLHAKKEGRSVGAYYTPESVADYVLSEINRELPLSRDLRVLDPSCGSGVFLVLAYRRLIEQELRAQNLDRLDPHDLKSLLAQSIFGIERDREACYVTQFSLILTLLSYLDPPQLNENREFRFPPLIGTNIFNGDFFDALPPFEKEMRFDWIVGNPPWTQAKKAARDAPVLKYIADNSETCPVTQKRVCEAFMWRVMELAASDGWIALLIYAPILFVEEGKRFRERFFSNVEIAKVTNFSNFAYRLFPSAEAPGASIVFKRRGELFRKRFLHYAPFVASQVTLREGGNDFGTRMLTIYENEIQWVDLSEVESGNGIPWKLALWGTYRDRRVLERLSRLLPLTLGQLSRRPGWNLRAGLQLRSADTSDSVEDVVKQLGDIPILDVGEVRASRRRLEVSQVALKPRDAGLRYVRQRSGKAGLLVAKAPHIYLAQRLAVFSSEDFLLPHQQIGLSGPSEDWLRALSLYLSSSVAQYQLFFSASSWGVFRDRISPKVLKRVRIPELTDKQIVTLSKAHRRISESEISDDGQLALGMFESEKRGPSFGTARFNVIQDAIDDVVEKTLKLPESVTIIARDFTRYREQFNKGKADVSAMKRPSKELLHSYGRALQSMLEGAGSRRYDVTIRQSGDYIECRICIGGKEDNTSRVSVDTSESIAGFSRLWDQLLSQHSQWVYVQRGLRVTDGRCIQIYKPNRQIDWIQSQALLDGDDIIADILTEAFSDSADWRKVVGRMG